MSAKIPLTFDDLPMFADDEKLGEAVLGHDRRKEFRGLAELLEPQGMPKVSPFWGGRCTEAVKRFLLADYGLTTETPLAPNGVEGKWETKRQAGHKARA
jgi:hypothetical protein